MLFIVSPSLSIEINGNVVTVYADGMFIEWEAEAAEIAAFKVKLAPAVV